MSVMRSTECLTGCSIRGQHKTTCETRDAANPCKGCLPRPSEFGNLCPFCWQRLNSDVIDAAPLVRYLRIIAEPHAGTKPPGDGRGHEDAAEGSMLSGAIDAADEIHSLLAAYAHLILDEHPHGEQMAGPDERGVRRTWDTWHCDGYGTYSRPSTVQGVIDATATERLVRWLLPLLPWCSEQEWAGEMRRELSVAVSTTKARWPVADTRDRAAGVPCISCNRMSLLYTPTSAFEAPFHVKCTNPDCGRTYTEDQYDGIIGKLAIARGQVA